MSESLPHHIQQLTELHQKLTGARESKVLSDAMLHQLEQIIDQLTQQSDTARQDASAWLAHTMSMAPQITPLINRELLWFFGGDCLHFLTDDEINTFQQQEEANEK